MNEPNYIIGNSKNINKIFKQKKLGKPQLIISSPPYFNILNYENNKDQIGFGQSYFEYLSDVSHVFQDCYKLSENNATFWLIIDTFKKDGEIKTLPFDINNRLKKRFKKTWKLKEIIIWDKEKNLPWNGKGNFKNQFEYILFFTKNDKFKFHIDRVREINDLKKWWKTYPERYNPDGKAPSNVWNYTTPIRGWGNSKQNHLCPFPFSLIEKIISIASDKGDLVLDPFAGSGSVLSISCMMERNSVGIDVNKEYKKLFKEEVLLGAKVYCDKREEELKKNKNAIEEFKFTNEKLRKLKVTSSIGSHINSINKRKFIYLTMDNNRSNKIDLFVVENGVIPKIDLKEEKIKKFLKQCKIEVNTVIINEKKLLDKYKDVKFFKYKFDKFYSYFSCSKLSNLIINPTKFEYIYSDIKIKIFDRR